MRITSTGILLFLVFAAFCSRPETVSKNKYRIGVPPLVRFAPLFIAAEKKMFKSRGVEVELIVENNLHRFYRENRLDGICLDYADAVMLYADLENVKLIYRLDDSIHSDVLIAKKEIKKVSDLKGKTISFDGVNTSSHRFVLNILKEHGIVEKDFRSFNSPPDKIVESLNAGKISAGHARGTEIARALSSGYKILANAGDVAGTLTDVIVLNSSLLKKNPEDARQIIAAVRDAIEFLKKSPGESAEGIQYRVGLSKEDTLTQLQDINYLGREENLLSMNKFDDTRGIEIGSSRNEAYIKLDPSGGTVPDKKIKTSINNSIPLPGRINQKGSLYSAGEEIIHFFENRGQFYRRPDITNFIDSSILESAPAGK